LGSFPTTLTGNMAFIERPKQSENLNGYVTDVPKMSSEFILPQGEISAYIVLLYLTPQE
jgi:hypothetical protein